MPQNWINLGCLNSSCGVKLVKEINKSSERPTKGPKSALNRSKALAWAKNAIRLKSISGTIKKRKPIKDLRPKKKDSKFKQAWRVIAGRRIYFRSSWEANVGRYLQWQKEHGMIAEWYHEPETFWFEGVRRGCVTYLPDFKVIRLDFSHEWLEVKGFMDAKSKTKIARFRKYYPKETLRILDAKWYKLNKDKLSVIIPKWEKG